MDMKKNMGNADRIIRTVVAIIFAALFFTGKVTGVAGIIMIVFAAIFLLTSLVSFCPLYPLVGINTCSAQK